MNGDFYPAVSECALELRTVRTRTHKLTIDLISGAGELYDLIADPQEVNNLFDQVEAAAIRSELIQMIESRPNDVRGNRIPVGTA